MPATSATPPTRKQADSASSSSKRQKKKPSTAEPSAPQDAPFAVEGHTEGIKLYSDNRCHGLKKELPQHALEPFVAEVDASGELSARNLVDVTLTELTNMRTLGWEFLTCPASLAMVQIMLGFNEDVSGFWTLRPG
jgi:hypothetical protein